MTNKEYKIINFDNINGRITVTYADSRLSDQIYEIPFDQNGKFIEGEELDNYIKNVSPFWYLDRLDKISNGIENFNNIEILVQPDDRPKPPVPTVEEIALMQRLGLLYESDWTQLPDVQLTEEQKEAWRIYRQALRDITNQSGWPNDITWPVKPT